MPHGSPTKKIELIAPLSGVMIPIEEVPDAVFAKKMVGEGISIDPIEGRLVSPVAGEVIDLQSSGHAVTVRDAHGLEVLMHIGLDTVRLQGAGFSPRVSVGDAVAVGDALIDFDLDAIAREAKSLLTQIVVANSDRIAVLAPATGVVAAGRDVAATVELAVLDDESTTAPAGTTVASDAILVPNPTGLHARPSATLVALAKTFTADVRLRRGDDSANAKSITSIMAMSVDHGDKIVVTAHGADAAEAVDAVSRAIREGLGEDCPPIDAGALDAGSITGGDAVGAAGATGTTGADVAGAAAVSATAASTTSATSGTETSATTAPRSGDPNILSGVTASPGLGVGTIVQLRHDDIEVAEFGGDRHAETRVLNSAIDRALLSLSALEKKLSDDSDEGKAAIFAAHGEILRDPELLDLARSGIDKGKSAAFAWRGAYAAFADRLAGLDNEVLAGRADDVRDVGKRVLEEITGQRREKSELPDNAILVAEELTPSDTAQLDRDRVVGFATTGGGASSHVAIIARSLDIPAVAGIETMALNVPDGTTAVLDGAAGTLTIGVSESDVAAIRDRQRRIAERKAADYARKDEPAVTTDGHRIAVAANIGGADDARQAITVGAEGAGLMRSEFAFMGRASAPTDDEQARIYAECARVLGAGVPLVVRTLDVGGDKPLPYVSMPAEENPFLGMRGIRIGLDRPDLLRSQCRAVLAAAQEVADGAGGSGSADGASEAGRTSGADLHLMFPMISGIDDWRRAKAIFDEERAAGGFTAKVSVGIMMEVPSVAVMAKRFAAEPGCDFFSVGTNDLTSYTLAIDRGHPKLAAQADGLDPAVLGLIANAAEALHEHGKWIGVCGGIAGDPQAVPILVGLGVDELSCSLPVIPSVKAAIRSRSRSECEQLASAALECATAAEVRALVPADDDRAV
ncbi:glucose PTS transporter subunit IIA [uncultured Corynebacterium sp.]|uniref:glucose PTS transporter subunit IIA n=1 Tax=uncultured Corynebacterium sp. TaxID=159447 RepID=UPI0025F44172|nr:glucose PTS transporter subunit IIA [uncultured Corynebacterium sp.]